MAPTVFLPENSMGKGGWQATTMGPWKSRITNLRGTQHITHIQTKTQYLVRFPVSPYLANSGEMNLTLILPLDL